MKFHTQPMRVVSLGLDTDITYRGGVTQGHANIRADGLPYIDTFVNNFHLVGTAGAEDLLIHNTIHITVNSNGSLTTEADNSSATCRKHTISSNRAPAAKIEKAGPIGVGFFLAWFVEAMLTFSKETVIRLASS